ncbi:ribosome maturation protein [Trichophaea hybrida]|nr:ribosome maturation protein [Trichophaea hybrida]
MARGNAQIVEVIYTAKGGECFIILVDSLEDYQAWKKDESIPLAQVVSGFKVFTAHKGGPQGIMDTASNVALENEFGTSKEEECIKKILRQGSTQVKTNPERQGDTNPNNSGLFIAH